jgi:hypothetical protein
MRGRNRTALIAAGLLAAVFAMVACEDTDVVTPEDAAIRLSAAPASVVLDTVNQPDVTEGVSEITAVAFDSGGAPLQGISITFSSDRGTFKRCDGTGALCYEDVDCPSRKCVGNIVETDGNGRAVADLHLVLARDLRDVDDTGQDVTVNAESGSVEATEPVKVNVKVFRAEPPEPNELPFASFDVIPANEQEVGRVATFDGSLSTDQDGDITCFQWEIDSNLNTFDEILQGPALAGFNKTYQAEMELHVTLRVSDDPLIGAQCIPLDQGGTAVAAYLFSPNIAFKEYRIVCSNPPPVANAGPDQSVPISSAQNVFLDGTNSFDRETGIGEFDWSCGSGFPPIQGAVPGQVFCRYSAPGIYEATLTVFDKGVDGVTRDPSGENFLCEKSDVDTATVTVFAPEE